jgi:acetone carboxylase gamma subunit
MSAPFEQLVGAAGDVRELEYISALHQTDTDQVRNDASIKGTCERAHSFIAMVELLTEWRQPLILTGLLLCKKKQLRISKCSCQAAMASKSTKKR